ncbi:MAG: hypothetical protein EXS63_09595, partial [Candidatus Omnitrophica bacterium]|nr:hypothetical protein [Candidatus Omnitrophota bacterium]
MMKPKTFFLILIGFSFFGTLVAATGEYPWQLRKDREGIRVSTRSVKDSPIYELRGEMTISVSLEKVTALYEKVEQMLKWFHRAKEVKLIQNISKNESIIYFAADLPWPLSDRDGVYRRVKSIDAATGAVIYTMTYAGPDLYPKQKDRVRVVYLDAEWKFT